MDEGAHSPAIVEDISRTVGFTTAKGEKIFISEKALEHSKRFLQDFALDAPEDSDGTVPSVELGSTHTQIDPCQHETMISSQEANFEHKLSLLKHETSAVRMNSRKFYSDRCMSAPTFNGRCVVTPTPSSCKASTSADIDGWNDDEFDSALTELCAKRAKIRRLVKFDSSNGVKKVVSEKVLGHNKRLFHDFEPKIQNGSDGTVPAVEFCSVHAQIDSYQHETVIKSQESNFEPKLCSLKHEASIVGTAEHNLRLDRRTSSPSFNGGCMVTHIPSSCEASNSADIDGWNDDEFDSALTELCAKGGGTPARRSCGFSTDLCAKSPRVALIQQNLAPELSDLPNDESKTEPKGH